MLVETVMLILFYPFSSETARLLVREMRKMTEWNMNFENTYHQYRHTCSVADRIVIHAAYLRMLARRDRVNAGKQCLTNEAKVWEHFTNGWK